jgi:hypothetical protein
MSDIQRALELLRKMRFQALICGSRIELLDRYEQSRVSKDQGGGACAPAIAR